MRRLPGSHAPNIKNRSSKHLSWLTGIRPIYRSMSKAALEEIMKADSKNRHNAYYAAQKELARRQKKRDKKEGLQV